jgi:cyclophilin family peptidyl-prolyl cis-trans isomerase
MKKILSILCGALPPFIFSLNGSAQTITNQPAGLTINNASTATFTVGADGATNYQWQFDGTNLSDGALGDGCSVTGSTNATLNLEDVTVGEAGTYTVLINNAVASSNATLAVVPGTIVTFTLSGLPAGMSNTIDVQLFDHDKPITTANFIHYIRSGAYTNMFFERCIPGFVLQGGDYGTTNLTNTINEITTNITSIVTTNAKNVVITNMSTNMVTNVLNVISGWSIEGKFTGGTNHPGTNYPAQIESEAGVGPMIHNHFGTIAMALSSGSNSATGGFFFNLNDNSMQLDGTNDGGPFTVFGMILDGSNVLQYFNGLGAGSGIVAADIFSNSGALYTNAFTNLPVNYSATNFPTNYFPANSNLISCDFTFSNSLPPDTIAPTLSIASPTNTTNLFFTNGTALTITGTAGDNAGLAMVMSTLVPLEAGDGAYPDYGETITNFASDPTNWSFNEQGIEVYDYFWEISVPIPPGSYSLGVQAQDGAGNLSQITFPVTVTGILVNGGGTVTVALGTNKAQPAIGYPLRYDTTYVVKAKPAAGQVFVNWNYGGEIATSSTTDFTYSGGVLTATFTSKKDIGEIGFTYPPANAVLTTNNFAITGKIAASVGPAQVACQIISQTTGTTASSLTANGTNTWSVAVTNLPPDNYLVQATVTNSSGFAAIISEKFSLLEFKGIAGAYSGLFICTNGTVAPTNSGLFTFTLSSSGVLSGKIYFPAYGTLPIYGTVSPTGKVGFSYTGFPDNNMDIAFALPVTNGTDTVTGSFYSQNSGGWYSQLICYREATKLSAQTTPPTGRYILSLNPGGQTNWPATNGYATVSVASSGAVSVGGALPDGATFSGGATIFTNGVWPLYAVPSGYKTNGLLLGWVTNQAGQSDGRLYWEKRAHVGAYDTNAVYNTNVVAAGTNFLRPSSAVAYSIVFGGGSLTNSLTNSLSVNAAGQFVVPKPAPSDHLSISLSSTGLVTGHFLNPVTRKTQQFEGAFMDTAEGGWGFFLDVNSEIGYFLIEAK